MRSIIICIGVLLISYTSMSQSTEESIQKIRVEFQRINASKQLKKIDLYNEDFMEYRTDGGGQLTGYFEKDQLVKCVEWIGVSFGIWIREYYFKDNALFFAYEQEKKFQSVYDTSGEWMNFDTSLEPEIIYEGRYYFDTTQLIKKLTKGERMFNQTFEKSEFLKHINSMTKLLVKTKD